MVKVDMTRDYYADLELPASCSEAEIKKQFKKLALKYHPDRNPGREAEVNSKFQTIQSAHEVLTDPTERSKYDAGRRLGAGRSRTTGFASTTTPQASGTKGNPWSNAGKEWAPPPKPPGFAPRRPPPSAGASRYTDNFATGRPAPPPRTAKDPMSAAEERKNNFTAWESMRNSKTSYRKAEEPGRSARDAHRQPSGRKVPPRPGSFANFNNEDDGIGRTPSQRKNGYAPNNSGGDEPAAASTSSYSTKRRPVPPIPLFDDAPDTRRAVPPSPPPDSTRPSRTPNAFYDEPRVSTPYTSHSGEKTNPFDGLGSKAASHDMGNGDFANGQGSDTSASPPKNPNRRTSSSAKAKYTPPQANGADSSSSDEAQEPRRRPIAVPRKSRSHTKDSTASNSSAKIFAGVDYSAEAYTSPRNAGKANIPSQYAPFGSYQDPEILSVAAHTKDFFQPAPFFAPISLRNALPPMDTKVPASKSLFSRTTNTADQRTMEVPRSDGLYPHEAAQYNLIDKIISRKSFGQGPFDTPDGTEPNYGSCSAKPCAGSFLGDQYSKVALSGDRCRRDVTDMTSYGTAIDGSSIAKQRSRSFSLTAANDQTTVDCSLHYNVTNGFQDADIVLRRFSSDADGSASPGPHTFTFASSAEKIDTAFSPDDWNGKFESGDYLAVGIKSNRQASSATRPRSPVKRRPVNKQPSVSQEDSRQSPSGSPSPTKFTAEEWDQTFKPQTFSPDILPFPGGRPRSMRRQRTGPSVRIPSTTTKIGNAAMVNDDSADDVKPLFDKQTASPNAMDIDEPIEPRNVPLEPSRADWRAGAGGSAHAPHVEDINDEEDFKTNFEDLKNVEPFNNQAHGLDSFNDLSSTLPFSSGASKTIPISRDFHSQNLVLPKPPKAPALPAVALDAQRPTESSWNSYLATFKGYMAEWSLFNQTMLGHFNARQHEFENIKVGWLDAHVGHDLDKYIAGVKEDAAVREWWNVAGEKHETAMLDFQWIKKLYIHGKDAISDN